MTACATRTWQQATTIGTKRKRRERRGDIWDCMRATGRSCRDVIGRFACSYPSVQKTRPPISGRLRCFQNLPREGRRRIVHIHRFAPANRAHCLEDPRIDVCGDMPHRAVGHDDHRPAAGSPFVPRPLVLSNSGSRRRGSSRPRPKPTGLAIAPVPAIMIVWLCPSVISSGRATSS